MSGNCLESEVESYNTLITELTEPVKFLADELDTRQRRLDVAKLTSASTGVIGGVLTVVGLSLAPFTFGASLGLTIAGGIVAGGSVIGNIGSMIADKVISKKSLNTATSKLNECVEKLVYIWFLLCQRVETLNDADKALIKKQIQQNRKLSEEAKKILIGKLNLEVFSSADHVATMPDREANEVLEIIINVYHLLHNAFEAVKKLTQMVDKEFEFTWPKWMDNERKVSWTTAYVYAGAANYTAKSASATGKAATAATGKAVASGVKVFGFVTAGAGIALDLGAMVYYSYKIHKNNPSELAEIIRWVSKCLNEPDTDLVHCLGDCLVSLNNPFRDSS